MEIDGQKGPKVGHFAMMVAVLDGRNSQVDNLVLVEMNE